MSVGLPTLNKQIYYYYYYYYFQIFTGNSYSRIKNLVPLVEIQPK